ncbi:MAG: PTS system mannose/fructose/sorbose family transporter subunit IID [Elusimicrobiaceae bacterium]|nr:PTS system mannose/fructose/sorbose family transporter subunit IID [Elusimicrobiaceae bacterium]
MKINKTKYILRSLLLQGFWNFRKMQNVGMLFIMYPYLCQLYPDKNKFFKRAILRNLEAFNTNPVMVPFCFGAVMKQEEVLAKSQEDLAAFYEQEREWLIIRSSISTTVASLGDRLFWSTLKPLSLVAAFVVLCLGQNHFLNDGVEVANWDLTIILALIIAFLIYNVPAFITRYKGFELGYAGTEENFFGLIKINWNKVIIILKTLGQAFTLFVFLYCLYFYFQDFVFDAYLITKITLLLAFVMLSAFVKKWNIPNIYLYLGSVLVFTIVALFS